MAVATVSTRSAGRDAGNQHSIADLDSSYRCADRRNRSDRFMAKYSSVRDSGKIAFEDMEVGTADGGGLNVNDGVGLVDDDWIISVFPRTVPRAVVNQCFHLGCRDRDGG